MVKPSFPANTSGMDSKSRFGIQLRSIRKRRGLTQERLAELIDRSVDAVSNMERGISLPGYETLRRLAEKLSVPLTELAEAMEAAPVDDPERVDLLTRLSGLARELDTRNLQIAVEHLEALLRHAK